MLQIFITDKSHDRHNYAPRYITEMVMVLTRVSLTDVRTTTSHIFVFHLTPLQLLLFLML